MKTGKKPKNNLASAKRSLMTIAIIGVVALIALYFLVKEMSKREELADIERWKLMETAGRIDLTNPTMTDVDRDAAYKDLESGINAATDRLKEMKNVLVDDSRQVGDYIGSLRSNLTPETRTVNTSDWCFRSSRTLKVGEYAGVDAKRIMDGKIASDIFSPIETVETMMQTIPKVMFIKKNV